MAMSGQELITTILDKLITQISDISKIPTLIFEVAIINSTSHVFKKGRWSMLLGWRNACHSMHMRGSWILDR